MGLASALLFRKNALVILESRRYLSQQPKVRTWQQLVLHHHLMSLSSLFFCQKGSSMFPRKKTSEASKYFEARFLLLLLWRLALSFAELLLRLPLVARLLKKRILQLRFLL